MEADFTVTAKGGAIVAAVNIHYSGEEKASPALLQISLALDKRNLAASLAGLPVETRAASKDVLLVLDEFYNLCRRLDHTVRLPIAKPKDTPGQNGLITRTFEYLFATDGP